MTQPDLPESPDPSRRSATPRATRRGARRSYATLAAIAVGLAACQTYAPAPIDADILEGLEVAFRGSLETLSRKEGGLDLADGVSLREAQLVALIHHTDLRAARAEIDVAAAGAEHAGSWTDPELEFDLLRIAESVSDRWVLGAGVAFTIPLGGTRDATRGLADAKLRVAELRAREAEWAVLHAIERDWIRWSAAELRAAESERLVDVLGPLVTRTGELADLGEMPPLAARLFEIEHAQRRSSARAQRADADTLALALRAAVGLPAQLDGRAVTLNAAPLDAAPAALEAKRDRHPTLARALAEYDAAEEALRLAVAEQMPDLTLGPAFESDAGQTRVGMLGGIPIPIWNRNRRGIAMARARREKARVAVEAEVLRMESARQVAAARVDALSAHVLELEQTVLPLHERQAADALALAQLGEVDVLLVLESLRSAHEANLTWIDARSELLTARVDRTEIAGPMTDLELEATQ